MDPRNILAPVDFGAPSLRACERAVALARDLRAGVTLLHAVDAPEYTLFPAGLAEVRSVAERKLRALANDLRRAHAPVDTRVVEGAPWRAIVTAVETERAELVVCGTHNRRGLAHLALGSVAERIVRASPVPVLTVPGFAFESREDAGRRLMMELPRRELPGAVSIVALGIDSAPVAGILAQRLGAPFDIWHCVPIELDGAVAGALGEDELAYYDSLACAESADRVEAEARAKTMLREQIGYMRGTGAFGDVLDRLVVLTAEHVSSAAAVRAAVRALRPVGVSGIVLATPVASSAALREVKPLVDGVLCLEQTIVAKPAEIAFRAAARPSYRKVRRVLADARASMNAAISPPTHFAS